MKTHWTTLFVVLLVTALVWACGAAASPGEAVSALSQSEATELIENAMQGFQAGDYAAWSRNWSYAMQNAIREDAFLAFRDQLTAEYGRFVSLERVAMEPGQEHGYVRWVATCNFEKRQVTLIFGFETDGRLIEGIWAEAVQ